MATRKRTPKPTGRPQKREAKAGFAVGTYDQSLIEENARDRADSRYGDPEWRDEMVRLGVLTRDGTITEKGWNQLNKDMEHLEGNSLAWLKRTFNSAHDHGHGGYGGEELVGNFWFDPTNYDQAWLVELASDSPGRSERIDMTDASFGDLANTAFDGVSDFGGAVLGGQINFFDVQPEDWATIEDTVARGGRGARRRGVGAEEAPRRRGPPRDHRVAIGGRGEVIPSRRWQRRDGATASPYGAVPWTGAPGDRKEDWTLENVGWTIQWADGTIGIGRQPFATREEAEAWLERDRARRSPAPQPPAPPPPPARRTVRRRR